MSWIDFHQRRPITLSQLPTLQGNINKIRQDWEETQDISKLMQLYFLQFAQSELKGYSKTAKKDPWGRAKGDIEIKPQDWVAWMFMRNL